MKIYITNIQKKMKHFKYIIYGIIILIIVFQFKTCFIRSKTDVLRVDTVEIVKIIPSKENTFIKDSLIPVYIDTSQHYEKLFKQLEKKYNKKTDSVTILRELLQATRKRKYKETFTDSVLDAEVVAHTTGTLDSLKFSYKTKPQEIRYNEITKYISPKFRILAGANASFGGDMNSTILGINAGIQDKKGNIYIIGVDTQKSVNFSAYINLFSGY